VIVENRGGGYAAIEIVQKATPDGYTLLYYGSILWLMPLLQDKVPTILCVTCGASAWSTRGMRISQYRVGNRTAMIS